MTVLLRFLLVLLAVLVVVVAARVIGRSQRPAHPPVDLGRLATEPGIVIFTSTDCRNCREALAEVERSGMPIRQVSHELEPGEFERAGVEAVPLTVVVDDSGAVSAVMTGVPRRRSLDRAISRAGLAPNAVGS